MKKWVEEPSAQHLWARDKSFAIMERMEKGRMLKLPIEKLSCQGVGYRLNVLTV